MNILIVNDDGINAKGIDILTRALMPHGSVYISAPVSHQSAKSAAITISNSITAYEVEAPVGAKRAVAVDGFPIDALRMGLKAFNIDFDLVVSGINNGPNIAKDIFYSGTVAAAMEAKFLGIPAIAISADNTNLDYLYDETIKILDEVLENRYYELDGILNINFPKSIFLRPLGVKWTKQGLRYTHTEYIKSSVGGTYHLKTSHNHYFEEEISDVKAFEEGFISLTPLKFDYTDQSVLNEKIGKED